MAKKKNLKQTNEREKKRITVIKVTMDTTHSIHRIGRELSSGKTGRETKRREANTLFSNESFSFSIVDFGWSIIVFRKSSTNKSWHV